VGVAGRAPDLCADRAQRAVLDQGHRVVLGRLVEARQPQWDSNLASERTARLRRPGTCTRRSSWCRCTPGERGLRARSRSTRYSSESAAPAIPCRQPHLVHLGDYPAPAVSRSPPGTARPGRPAAPAARWRTRSAGSGRRSGPSRPSRRGDPAAVEQQPRQARPGSAPAAWCPTSSDQPPCGAMTGSRQLGPARPRTALPPRGGSGHVGVGSGAFQRRGHRLRASPTWQTTLVSPTAGCRRESAAGGHPATRQPIMRSSLRRADRDGARASRSSDAGWLGRARRADPLHRRVVDQPRRRGARRPRRVPTSARRPGPGRSAWPGPSSAPPRARAYGRRELAGVDRTSHPARRGPGRTAAPRRPAAPG